MKNRLTVTAFSVIVCGFIFSSCTKEKIQANPTAGKVINGNIKSSSTSSSAVTESSDTHGGCSNGNNGTGTGAYQGH